MVKRVIIVRKDLRNIQGQKITTGKYIAQAAHAVEGSLLRKMYGKKYEEGIRIYKQCHDIINSAELKIKVLNDDNCDGGI